MPTFDHFDSGNTCWVDLTTADVEDAVAFYTELFSWTAEQKRSDYTEFALNGKTVAAVLPLMAPNQPSTWNTYVSVDDADATAAAVREAGGQVLVEPTAIDTIGKFAVFADSSGNAFCVWEPGTVKGVEFANEPNSWGYSEVVTSDVKRAQEFYGRVFDWEAKSNAKWGMEGWSWFLGDKHLGGLMETTSTEEGRPISGWLAYFGVEDIEATVAMATKLGGTLERPIIETPIGKFGVLADSQGASFGVAQMSMG